MDEGDDLTFGGALKSLGILAGAAILLSLMAATRSEGQHQGGTRKKQRPSREGRSGRSGSVHQVRTSPYPPPPPVEWDEVLTRAEYEEKIETVLKWRRDTEGLAKNPGDYPPPSAPIYRDTHTVLKAYGSGGWGPMPKLSIVCAECLRHVGRLATGFPTEKGPPEQSGGPFFLRHHARRAA